MLSTNAKPHAQGERLALARAAGAAVLLSMLVGSGAVLAGPTGGQVVAGSGSIQRPNVNTTLIQQQSQSLSIDWAGFDVAGHELVKFQQPSAASAVLNRVFNELPSQIHGRIQANGQVFIMNPNGVVFGPGARVEVGGLMASSLDIDVDDFMGGLYRFSANDARGSGLVVNQGLIEAATGGVTLLGASVRNDGVIIADVGHVLMGAGRQALVDFDGDGLIRFQVDEAILQDLSATDSGPAAGQGGPGGQGSAVVNNGEIRADGGQVLLSAAVARGIVDSAVNNTGIIRAASIDHARGVVTLSAAGGRVENAGTIDVSATGAGAAGSVALSSDVGVLQHGQIHADGLAGDGGRVTLESAGVTRLDGAGGITARSAGGKGGEVRVLGDAVALRDAASIDVSGARGGGTVLVGGDYQGANPSVANARLTAIAPQARIQADATHSGDGGRVIVWSDDTTDYFGTISARGGPAGGAGGFVEVSAKRSLNYRGSADLSAANGSRGTLLLDPEFLLIVGGSGDGDGDGFNTQFAGGPGSSAAGSILFSDAGPSIIYQSEIEAQSATANIALQATGSIFTTGSFTNGALTLAADSNLLIESRNPASGSGGVGTVIINLITSSQGENLDIVTSGSGTITVTAGGGGSQSTAIYLPNLLSGADIVISAGGGPDSSVQVFGTVSGANVSVDATGMVSVMGGARLVAGGDGTTLEVVAGGIALHDGVAGAATASNSATGAVSLTSTDASFDMELGENAIATGVGPLSVRSARSIRALNSTDATNTRNEIDSAGTVFLTAAKDIGSGSNFIEIGGVADLVLDLDEGSFFVSGANGVGGAGRALSSLKLLLSPESSSEYVLENFAAQTFEFTQGAFGDNLVVRDITSASPLDLNITTREHGIVIGGSGADGIQLSGASNVRLDSAQGIEEAINDDAAIVSAEITTDGRLTLVAAKDIGAGGLLDVAAGSTGVSALEATATAGAVRINGLDAVRIDGAGIVAAEGGALQSSRALTIAADVQTGADMSFTARNNGALAGNDVTITEGAAVILDSAAAAALRFSAGDNIAFDDGRIQAVSANGQRVELLADGEHGGADGVVGQVTQTGTGVSISAGHLSVAAGAGIGTGAALQTAVATLTAVNSTTGDLNIANEGDLLVLGNLRNNANAGDLTLRNDNGALNTGIAEVASAGGVLTLEARESDATAAPGDRARITVGPGGLKSAGGAIAVRAADGVTMNGAVTNDGGDVAIGAGQDSLEAAPDGIGDLRIVADLDTGAGALSLSAGAAIEQLNGSIRTTSLSTDSGGATTLNHPDNAVAAFRATAGADVALRNRLPLSIGSSDVGGDLRIDNAQAVNVVDRVKVAGTATLTTAAGNIDGGAGGVIEAGGLALDSAQGIGAGTVLDTRVSGAMSLRSRGAAADGNIAIHQQGDLATSQIALLTTDTASAQSVAISAGNVLSVDKDPVDSPNLQLGDSLELDANRIALAEKISGSGVDVRFKAPVDVTGASVFIDLDQSLLTFDENVSPGSNTALTIRSEVVFASGQVTGKPGSTLVIADTLNLITDTTIAVDNLQLNGDPASLTGTGNLTLLPATHGGNITLGGSDGLAPDITLATLQGFGGGRTLSIGVPVAPSATSPYAGNVTVNRGLDAGDAVLTVGGLGDVTLNNHGDPLRSDRVINIVAIGDRRVFPGLVVHKGGDILDTDASAGAPATLVAPEVNVIAQGRVGVASNALEVQVGSGGSANFVTGASNAFINTDPGGESVTNVAGVSVLLAAFQSLGFFLDTLNQAALGRTVGLETTGLETTGLGELLYVDEGLYLLPQPYTTPIQATLLPALVDPDFPANRRPDDADDEAAWQLFFAGVLKDYVQSRYPVPDSASAEQRAAIDARMQREWQSLVDYFQKTRDRERAAVLTGNPLSGSGG